MTASGDFAIPAGSASAPDWSLMRREILCPLCEYNLRGLIEPRCPECGGRFEWAEILKSEKFHPFLFEHHPNRNARTLWRTYVATLCPWSFWKKLLPTHEPNVSRLILYWLLLIAPALLTSAAAITLIDVQERNAVLALRAQDIQSISRFSSATYKQQLIAKYGSVQAFVDQWYPMPSLMSVMQTNWKAHRIVVPIAAAVVVWPWLTISTLLIFRESLAQARIKPAHVMRCVLYSASTVSPLVPIILVFSLFAPMLFTSLTPAFVVHGFIDSVLFIAWLAATVGMAIAYHRYLRFPHSIATLLSAQVVVGLAMFKIYLMFLGN